MTELFLDNYLTFRTFETFSHSRCGIGQPFIRTHDCSNLYYAGD
jgi:hypothetical protein